MSNRTGHHCRTILGRADLVAAWAANQPGMLDSMAEQLGLRYEPPADLPDAPRGIPRATETSAPITANTTGYPRDAEDIGVWVATRYMAVDSPSEPTPHESKPAYIRWHNVPQTPPTYRPLAPWSVVQSRLRRSHINRRSSQRVDVPKLVDQVARREVIDRVPRLQVPGWNGRLVVVRDRSLRLVPFEHDQQLVIQHLKELFPCGEVRSLEGTAPDRLRTSGKTDAANLTNSFAPHSSAETLGEFRVVTGCDSPLTAIPTGSLVLVLGDLGVLSHSWSIMDRWYQWGRALKRNGCQLQSLVPCSVAQVPVKLRELFAIECGQQKATAFVRDPQRRRQLVRAILALASPAWRLEPGLMRDLRLLVQGADDASLETDVWMSSSLASNHPEAATLHSHIITEQLQGDFEALPESTRERAIQCVRRWHAGLEPEIGLKEMLCLTERDRGLIPDDDIKDAQACIRELVKLANSEDEEVREDANTFLGSLVRANADSALIDPEVGELLRNVERGGTAAPRGSHETFSIEVHDNGISFYPAGWPGLERGTSETPEVSLASDQKQSRKDAAPGLPSRAQSSPGHLGGFASHVSQIRTSNGRIEIWSADAITNGFWKTGKPEFVSDYGTDQYGAWFEFQIETHSGRKVTQRMRWIPPGTFLMGSPINEPERFDSEGPQHEVALTHGYWLADTTCTQELWQAVTGKTPSGFKGDARPVEKVSYSDVQEFIEQVNAAIPGLCLQLPSEAQWEYACRAGTTTPFSFGDQITTDQVNYDGRYPYNSGPQGEYRQQTMDCNALPPNDWGLYQMHGNVWEWCEDWRGPYLADGQRDPTGPAEGSRRVVRGGSWFRDARVVRSAYRASDEPGYRLDYLGFRLLSSARAEPKKSSAWRLWRADSKRFDPAQT